MSDQVQGLPLLAASYNKPPYKGRVGFISSIVELTLSQSSIQGNLPLKDKLLGTKYTLLLVLILNIPPPPPRQIRGVCWVRPLSMSGDAQMSAATLTRSTSDPSVVCPACAPLKTLSGEG